MNPFFRTSEVRLVQCLVGGVLSLLLLVVPATMRAADGEVLGTPIVPYKTYTFTPGKLTGQEFVMEKEKLKVRVFSFEQFRTFPKPKETTELRLSLRDGYRAHDLFGHNDFEPKEAQGVATGWVPLASGNFIVFPDQSKKHLPKWIPERTRLIRVPLVKQYGDTVVNAYDLALGLDRFNKGDLKPIEFQLVPATDDNGKAGVRLIPTSPLSDGVYYAYSLPDEKDTANYGFLFVVGKPILEAVNSQAEQGQTQFQPNICLLPDVKLALDVIDYALLSEAVYKEKTVPNWELLNTATCPVKAMECWKNIEETSFQVQVYLSLRGRKPTLAVAFRGTEINEIGDWKADLENFFNRTPRQYEQAVEFVKQIVEKAGPNYDIVLTGHSLGGGLASYAALRQGTRAIVFNAAGLKSGLIDRIPKANLERQKALVTNVNLAGDPVSGLGGQVGIVYALSPHASLINRAGAFVDNRTLMVGPLIALRPETVGEAKAVSINPIDYHFIAPLIETLKGLAK